MGLAGTELVSVLSNPRSVAIVGASATPGSYSHRAFSYLRDYGYAGALTLVNPHREQIGGTPCLSSISLIEPGSIDLAMVAVSAPLVPDAVAELAAIGARVAVVIANGLDPAAKDSIRETAARSGMRVIGPNCIGVVSTHSHAYVSFSAVVGQAQPRQGRVALVTQSGAMGNALMLSIQRRGAGVSHWFTTGDEVNVGALELITGLLAQDTVDAVGAFFEGMGDTEWLPLLRASIKSTGKRVYVVKGAQTAAGRSAAAGHTGRVVGSGDASVSVMRDAGISVLTSMAALSDALVASDLIGTLSGPRIGVVTVSGGAGVLAADSVARSRSLQLLDLPGQHGSDLKTDDKVHDIRNPLDVGGSSTARFVEWVDAVARHPSCDVVLAIQANIMHDQEVLATSLRSKAGAAPVVIVPFSEEDPLSADVVLRLAGHGVVTMPSPERAIDALAALPLSKASELRASDLKPDHDDVDVLGLESAVAILGRDLDWAPWAIVNSADEAREWAAKAGYPVVLKIAGRRIHHRSDAGGVALNVGQAGIDDEFSRISAIAQAAGDAVLIQKQAGPGMELLVSGWLDPEVGPVVVVRVGGVFTEMMNGSVILWSGWSPEQRRLALVHSIVGTVLDGYRGGRHFDLVAVCSLVEHLVRALDNGTATFVELNPVIVHPDGLVLVDALVRK